MSKSPLNIGHLNILHRWSWFADMANRAFSNIPVAAVGGAETAQPRVVPPCRGSARAAPGVAHQHRRDLRNQETHRMTPPRSTTSGSVLGRGGAASQQA